MSSVRFAEPQGDGFPQWDGPQPNIYSQTWFLAVFASLAIVTAGWILSHAPSRYEATATVRCVFKDSAVPGRLPTVDELEAVVFTRQVLEPAFRRVLGVGAETRWDEFMPAAERRLRLQFEKQQPGGQIQIAFTDRDPERALDFVREAAVSFVEQMRHADPSNHFASEVRKIRSQFDRTEHDWLSAWNRLKQLHSHPLLAKTAISDDELADVERRLAEALRERDEWQAAIDLPLTPALARGGSEPESTLAQRTLKNYLKQRAQIVQAHSEDHPAVVNLDRKIRELAAQSGQAELTTDEGIRQASLESAALPPMQSLSVLEREIARLQEKRQSLRERCESKSALECQLGDCRAEVEELFAQKGRLKTKLEDAERRLAKLHSANPIVYLNAESEPAFVRRLGPDRRKWFLGVCGVTALLACGCRWIGSRAMRDTAA